MKLEIRAENVKNNVILINIPIDTSDVLVYSIISETPCIVYNIPKSYIGHSQLLVG